MINKWIICVHLKVVVPYSKRKRKKLEVSINDIMTDYLYLSIYLSIYKLIKVWSPWLIDCMFEAVRTNPGYGMATVIFNNLLNLILGTVMFLRSS